MSFFGKASPFLLADTRLRRHKFLWIIWGKKGILAGFLTIFTDFCGLLGGKGYDLSGKGRFVPRQQR